jgi:hypothetical protein
MARLIALLAVLLIAASPSPRHHHQAHKTQTTEEKGHPSPSQMSTLSNQPSPKPTPTSSGNYTYNYYYPTTKSESPPVWFQVLATLVLLAFTLGLWRSSILQWRAMQESLRIAQRAIVGIKRIDFALARRPRIAVVFENYGHTGAKSICVQARAVLDTKSPEHIDIAKITLPSIVKEVAFELMPGLKLGNYWITQMNLSN